MRKRMRIQTESGICDLQFAICNLDGPHPGPPPAYRGRERWLVVGMLLGALALVAGCAQQKQPGHWDGPQALSTSSVDSWQYKNEAGWQLHTRHYLIYTTIGEDDVRGMLPQVMEGAYAQYVQLVPGVPLSERAMECYLFRKREEWNDFTRATTGRDAQIYLQIRRGGYALQDRYVAYYIGVNGTASVAAHEGWHQFVARNCRGRLPAFVEEGL